MKTDNQIIKNTRVYEIKNGLFLRVQLLTSCIVRFSCSQKLPFAEPLLNRYKFIKDTWPDAELIKNETDRIWNLQSGDTTITIEKSTGILTLINQVETVVAATVNENGFQLVMPLSDDDRLFGLGDENRDAIMKRGRKATIWASNVKSYIPIPFLASNKGWGILVNTTFCHYYDLGATQSDQLKIWADEGPCDFYLMLADNWPGVIDLYTKLTGRPALLPKYAFGYTFVCNEENNARAMLDDARMFRETGVPCDCIGLEPDWMEKHYDFSVAKKWHPTKFYIPYWIQDMHRHHELTYFGALHRLGFRLSLWLCCDYDLLWEEENQTAVQQAKEWDESAQIADEHFSHDIRMDRTTVPGQSWFEHLKQFVHQGVSAFKLDGANFILEHPDRVWADRYLDREVHNLLPLVYGRQMSRGYTDYTGERAMINIPMGYAGIQQYCATWAGDTGGGAKPLVSMLNLGHCGVSSTSCDIEVSNKEGIHFGFLQAWTQQNNWNYWLQPWLLGKELEEMVRFYACLRSSLFPYLYSYAYVAYETGMPLMRSMSLSYLETDIFDDVMTQYMLGDALLVTAFSDEAVLPDGDWYDFWTDQRYQGNQTIEYNPPENRGGGLFVKAGSIIPMQTWAPSLENYTPDCLFLHVFSGGSFTIYLSEDDGITEQYRQGAVAKTMLQLQYSDNQHTLKINKRSGAYQGIGSVTAFKIYIHGSDQLAIHDAAGQTIDIQYEDNLPVFNVSAEKHQEADVAYTW